MTRTTHLTLRALALALGTVAAVAMVPRALPLSSVDGPFPEVAEAAWTELGYSLEGVEVIRYRMDRPAGRWELEGHSLDRPPTGWWIQRRGRPDPIQAWVDTTGSLRGVSGPPIASPPTRRSQAVHEGGALVERLGLPQGALEAASRTDDGWKVTWRVSSTSVVYVWLEEDRTTARHLLRLPKQLRDEAKRRSELADGILVGAGVLAGIGLLVVLALSRPKVRMDWRLFAIAVLASLGQRWTQVHRSLQHLGDEPWLPVFLSSSAKDVLPWLALSAGAGLALGSFPGEGTEGLRDLLRGRFTRSQAVQVARGLEGALATGLVACITVLSLYHLVGIPPMPQPNHLLRTYFDAHLPWIAIPSLAAIAAIGEELLFRHLGTRTLLKLTGNRALALTIPALLFGFTHSAAGFLPPGEPIPRALMMTAIGLLWGNLYLRHGLLAAMVCHFTTDVILAGWPHFAAGRYSVWAVLLPLLLVGAWGFFQREDEGLPAT